MRAFRLRRRDDAGWVDVPEPEPITGRAVVRPVVSGICGTDLHAMHDGVDAYPVTMGHEAVGRVIAIGPADTKPAAYRPVPVVGDLVAVDPLLPCGSCTSCLRGRPNICTSWRHLGLSEDGVFAEYVSVPLERCFVVPAGLDAHIAALIEPIACALAAVEKARPAPEHRVAVVGAGPFGLQMIAVLNGLGIDGIVAVEPDERRQDTARAVGATQSVDIGEGPTAGFDVVLEAAGAAGSLVEAIRLAGPGGVVVAAGLPSGTVGDVDQRRLVMREITVHGSVSHAWRFPAAAALLVGGRIDPTLLVSGTYAIDDLAEALAVAWTGGANSAGKLMLEHPDPVD